MAMVVARKGKHQVKVSKSSYETLFKDKGYKLVGEEKKSTTSMMDEDFDEEIETEQKQEEVETVPISEMSKEQLAEYAKEHNIDTSSARNVREARQIIQKAIRESRM